MGRRGRAPRRKIEPDVVHSSRIASRVIHKLMLDGRKSVAQAIFYEALETAAKKVGDEPIEVLEAAIRNIMPVLEVRPRRVGGATYQVPMEVRPERRTTLAVRWLVGSARDRNERTMTERLAGELVEAANNGGNAVRRKEEMHRMAEANKAFAHYRW